MAEIVNERIEDMLTELEQMKRIDLYSQDEIKEISKKRKEFEYKIHRQIRNKEDFLRYIAYECLLLHDIRLRREKYLIEEKKSDIEYTISKRVIKLYKEMISRFGNDLDIWLNFIKFCKNSDLLHTVTSYMEKLLQLHGDKPKVWQLAARWEYEEMHDIENARNILIKAILRFPKYEDLYVDVFRIELLIAEAVTDEKKEKKMVRAQVILDNGLQQIEEVSFVVKLCKVANEFNFTKDIKMRLFKHLWDNHIDSIQTWNFIAQCEIDEIDVAGFDWKNMTDVKLNTKYSVRYSNYVNVYETALSLENVKNSCINYINSSIKNCGDDRYNDVVTFQILNSAMFKGHTMKILTEDHYKLWLNILCLENKMNRDQILNILEEACENLPTSEFIWFERLKRCTDNSNELVKVFKLAKAALPSEKVAQVWGFVIENMRDINKLKKLFEQSMTLPASVAKIIKPKFLMSFYIHGDIAIARDQYMVMANAPPLVLELHNTMLELELSLKIIDIKNSRNCYELAIQQFGSKSPDLWLSYINFENKNGQPERCGSLYKRGLHALEQSSAEIFITKYSLNLSSS